MTVKAIEIAKVDTSGRLRPINPTWVEAMTAELRDGASLPPIEVVERGDGYRLIAGGHRIAAVAATGATTIEARVWPADAFADEAAVRLREIQENMIRYELTALDRAVHLAAWKEIHEAMLATPKRGRKSMQEKSSQDPAAIFVERFTAAAARVLQISERSVQDAVSIAKGIGPAIRQKIAAAPIADNAGELRLLASQHPDRQAKIVELLQAEPPIAGSVGEAIAILDRIPTPARPTAVDRLSDGFARLKDAERTRFFEAHADLILEWVASRGR